MSTASASRLKLEWSGQTEYLDRPKYGHSVVMLSERASRSSMRPGQARRFRSAYFDSTRSSSTTVDGVTALRYLAALKRQPDDQRLAPR